MICTLSPTTPLFKYVLAENSTVVCLLTAGTHLFAFKPAEVSKPDQNDMENSESVHHWIETIWFAGFIFTETKFKMDLKL